MGRHSDVIVVKFGQVIGLIDHARRLTIFHTHHRLVLATGERADCFLFGGHESVVGRHVSHAPGRDKLDVGLLRAADMRNGILCELDACLAVSLDHVTSDVWIALLTLNDEAVIPTTRDDVLPNLRRTELRAIRSRDLDAVLVRTLNLVLNDVGLVVVNLYADLVQVELVAYNLYPHQQSIR